VDTFKKNITVLPLSFIVLFNIARAHGKDLVKERIKYRGNIYLFCTYIFTSSFMLSLYPEYNCLYR